MKTKKITKKKKTGKKKNVPKSKDILVVKKKGLVPKAVKIKKEPAKKSEKETGKKVKPLSNIAYLHEKLGMDIELTLFFMTWIECDRNATKAYKKLHKDVSDDSARVLGSRQLAKVNIEIILEGYGLGTDTYMSQLKNGLEATKQERITDVNISGEVVELMTDVPDHKVRSIYHTKLGKILGIEKPEQTNVLQMNQNNNQNNNSIDNIKDDELENLLTR